MALEGDLGSSRGYKYFFLVIRLAIYYIEFVIYIMSLDIIKEIIITTAELNNIKVY